MWVWIASAAVVVVLLAVVVILLRRRAAHESLVSVVLLRRRARPLTEADVRGAARRVYGSDVEVHAVPPPDKYARGFLVRSETIPPIVVITASRAYILPDEAEAAARRHEHPVVRAALREHAAWMSVDAVGAGSLRGNELAAAHALLARLAAEFYDDDCLLLYLPARKRIAQPGPDVETKLREGRLAELFADDELHAPMYSFDGHDAEIDRAMAEAQRRLPEFLAACGTRTDDKPALFKARFDVGDGNEYVWMSVVSVGSSDVEGRIENTPVGAGIPAKGQNARIPFDRIVDWAYIDAKGKGHGLFVERILAKRLKKEHD